VSLTAEQATAFVDGYGKAWEDWDLDGFVDLFSDDVVYVEHPTDETVTGRAEMERYIRKEQAEQGAAKVRMGRPMVEGDKVVAEFWATMSNRKGEAAGTLMGCFIARLDPADGRCANFRQYWFDVEGVFDPSDEWGT
jgi:ketosteroid isomerase-like protein